MSDLRTIRSATSAFKHFMEDRTGRPSSSVIYPDKLIYYFLRLYRNKVSYEDKYLKARADMDLNIELTIPCVELEKVDMVECPCAPRSGCEFFKSVHPLPKMLNGKPNSVTLLLQKADQPNYGKFSFVDWTHFQYKINSRIKAQAFQPYFTMKNINSKRHLYVYANMKNYNNLKAVAVAANFNDPLEVASFPVCGESDTTISCNPLDQEFMVEDEILSKVFELTYNALSSFKNFNVGADILNNDNNETTNRVL